MVKKKMGILFNVLLGLFYEIKIVYFLGLLMGSIFFDNVIV